MTTPIGNLGDISQRAIETLRSSSLICCEDTRHSGSLLARIGVSGVPLAVCNEHNESQRAAQVIERLAAGEQVALITDAGTP
ncbi:MAG TPA: 16S rRNA (cytidine(1402)-2'-O)-methyltransferase, partial [Ilumatobacteraceae bacterium]|nr:16S rRNA (cytidine(1402)-2'-O)-methyltransferase [Ilumatobacteraceae bacterium]